MTCTRRKVKYRAASSTNEQVGRIFFLAKTACGLAGLAPPQGDAYYTVITMTATDPDGATAHATGTFRTDPATFGRPSLSSATVDGTAGHAHL